MWTFGKYNIRSLLDGCNICGHKNFNKRLYYTIFDIELWPFTQNTGTSIVDHRSLWGIFHILRSIETSAWNVKVVKCNIDPGVTSFHVSIYSSYITSEVRSKASGYHSSSTRKEKPSPMLELVTFGLSSSSLLLYREFFSIVIFQFYPSQR